MTAAAKPHRWTEGSLWNGHTHTSRPSASFIRYGQTTCPTGYDLNYRGFVMATYRTASVRLQPA